MMRRRGVIKKYNGERGFGFIVPDADGDRHDLFFHISAFPRDVVPEIGQRVSFETGFDRNAKPIAVGIEVIGRFVSANGVA